MPGQRRLRRRGSRDGRRPCRAVALTLKIVPLAPSLTRSDPSGATAIPVGWPQTSTSIRAQTPCSLSGFSRFQDQQGGEDAAAVIFGECHGVVEHRLHGGMGLQQDAGTMALFFKIGRAHV